MKESLKNEEILFMDVACLFSQGNWYYLVKD